MIEKVREYLGIEKKFFELCEKGMESDNLNLYDLEYLPRNKTLRLFIMDPKTQTALIEDCVRVDKAFDQWIENIDWIPDDLVLEVSSPGVYRKLKTRGHFELCQKQMIKLGLSKVFEKESIELDMLKKLKKRKYIVELLEVGAEEIVVDVEGSHLTIPFSLINKANLELRSVAG